MSLSGVCGASPFLTSTDCRTKWGAGCRQHGSEDPFTVSISELRQTTIIEGDTVPSNNKCLSIILFVWFLQSDPHLGHVDHNETDLTIGISAFGRPYISYAITLDRVQRSTAKE